MRTLQISALAILGILIMGCSSGQRTGGGLFGTAQTPPPEPPADAPLAKEPAIKAETHFAAGQLAESRNDPAAAIAQYQEALKIKPDHLASLYRMGVVFAQLKQYPKAVEAWEKYVGASGESATAYADLGFCQELAGQPQKAEAAYMAGIARDSRSVPCRVNYGLMLGRRGQISDAVAQWRFVLSEAEIHYNLGSVYAAQGRKEQARLEYNKALELDPKLTDAQSRVASLDRQ